MSNYISPILGELTEDKYNSIITGIRRLRYSIIFLESEFNEPREFIGAELYNHLLNSGFSDSVSTTIVRHFSANQRLIDELLEQGFDIDTIVYGIDKGYSGRLEHLNLTSLSVTRVYAFENTLTVYPIIEIPEFIKEITIEIIPYELPFTINNEEDKENLIKSIQLFDDKELNKDVNDLRREIETEHEIEIYYKETGEISGMSIKPVTTKVYATDITIKNRKEWTWMTIDAMYEKTIVPKVIKRYSKTFGIQNPPGENVGSYDWRLKFNSITLKAKYME